MYLEAKQFAESFLRYSGHKQIVVILMRLVKNCAFIDKMRLLCELSGDQRAELHKPNRSETIPY